MQAPPRTTGPGRHLAATWGPAGLQLQAPGLWFPRKGPEGSTAGRKMLGMFFDVGGFSWRVWACPPRAPPPSVTERQDTCPVPRQPLRSQWPSGHTTAPCPGLAGCLPLLQTRGRSVPSALVWNEVQSLFCVKVQICSLSSLIKNLAATVLERILITGRLRSRQLQGSGPRSGVGPAASPGQGRGLPGLPALPGRPPAPRQLVPSDCPPWVR